MREKVERLAKGIFEYDKPEIALSVERISENIASGSILSGVFVVSNSKLSVMKGMVTSSGEILVVKTVGFLGAENEIHYEIHAEYAKPGEVYRGNITIISDSGEVKLPFDIQVMPMSCISPEGEVRDLFQLAGLAQQNFQAATSLLFSEAFERTILKDRIEDRTLYEQLKKSASRERALEEFLVSCKKKAPVHLKCDLKELNLTGKKGEMMERINLFRDTWGYTDITISTKGDFFSVSPSHITSESFTAGRCSIEVTVDFNKLSEGVHFGSICLNGEREDITIPVVCRCFFHDRQPEEKRRAFRETEGKLLRRYFDFRMGRVKSGSFFAEAASIVELLLVKLQETIFSKQEQDRKYLIYQMQKTYFLLVAGKTKKALEELERIEAVQRRGMLSAELQGACFYLEAMSQTNPEQVFQYTSLLRDLSEQNRANSWLLWFYLYTDQRKEGARAYHLERIKEWFLNGGRSPFIYFEAALIFNEDVSLLTEFEYFEQQVVLFALESRYLLKETCLQCALLALRKKVPDKPMLRCLQLAYEQYGQREVLRALCSLLIENQITEKKHHQIFSDACVAQLKLPGLQESYIYTCDLSFEEELDTSVLMFFAYDNELREPYRGFLYAYIFTNRDKYPSLYRTYRKKVEQYVISCILQGEINEYLSILYKDVLYKEMLDSEMAEKLPGLIFSYRLRCVNKKIKTVAVLHKEEKEETVYELKNDETVIHLYSEDASIVLIDAKGGRYLKNEDAYITRLYNGENLLNRCYELFSDNHCLLLNMLEKERNFHSVSLDVNEIAKRIVHLDNLKEEFRQSELFQLLKHYYDEYQRDLLDSYLNQVSLDFLNKADRIQVVELYILRGCNDLAVNAIARYGMDGISPKRVLMLCERLLIQCTGEQNDMLLSLCSHVFFEGQYNEEIIQYLLRYFNGTTAEMYQIWLASAEYSMNAFDIEERLLSQILFAESYLPSANQIFLKYASKRGNALLIKAFLSYSAFKFFVFDSPLQDELLAPLKSEAADGNNICRLAFLKKLSEEDRLSDQEKLYAEREMQDLIEQGKVYPFFRAFENKAELPACMADKVYVEYYTNPEYPVHISYLRDNEETDRFQTDDMRSVGYGFFVKEFILFYGEVLQYYITEEREQGPLITESFFCKMNEDKPHDETTKYGQINLILTAQELGDEKTSMDMLESYYRMEYTVNHLFAPIKE